MSFDNHDVCIDRNVCANIKGWSLNVTNINCSDSPYTVKKEDVVIFADATLCPIEVDLTKCICFENPNFIIKKTDNTPNTVRLIPSPGTTINEGNPHYDIEGYEDVVWFIYDDDKLDWRNIMNDLNLELTNKGDLLTHNGSNIVVLPVGLDGQVLIADSTEPSGLKYVNGGGGGEINTGTNVGVGVGRIYKQKVGTVLEFKSILAGKDIVVENLTSEVKINVQKGYEIISTSSITTPNPNITVSEIKINTSGGGSLSVSLPDPSPATLGQEKIIVMTQKTGTDTLTINPTTFVNGTGILFDCPGQSARLMWTSLGWANTGGSGFTIIP